MKDFKIRKFTHYDTDAFIRLATSAFADEWIADGMTPDGFACQTRQMFRWNMIPLRLITALTGIQWEAFVAEVNGRIVGGGMYGGRKNRVSITNLMVEPAFRRQGIGQALLERRLERLSQRRVPFVTVKVLETNQASLGNLRKQGFVEYSRISAYEHSLPILAGKDACVVGRELRASDRPLFRGIEQEIMAPFLIHTEELEIIFFPSLWQKLYRHFAGFHYWAQAFDVDRVTTGFLAAYRAAPMTRGYVFQPIIVPGSIPYFPAMVCQATAWMESAGLQSVKIEVSDQLGELGSCLLDEGWDKQYTWICLVKWLDEKSRQEFSFKE